MKVPARRDVGWTLLALLWIAIPPCGVAADSPLPQVGYGDVALGASDVVAHQHFPGMVRRFRWTPATQPSLSVESWALTGQTVGPCRGCNVELRFFRGRLFRVAVAYASVVSADVQAYLEQTYGPPSQADRRLWRLPGVQIVHSSSGRYWLIDDLKLGSALKEIALAQTDSARALLTVFQPPERPVFTPPTDDLLRFERRTVTIPTAGAYAVAVGDFNRDTRPDLLVTGAALYFLPGKGDGSFATPVVTAIGTTPLGIAIGDLNRDRLLDAVIATAEDNSLKVLLGRGDGTFNSPTTLAAGFHPTDVVIADLNGDGHPDLATANQSNRRPQFDVIPGTISVFLGDGSGRFRPEASWPAHKYPTGIASADFDGDQKADLAVTNRGSGDVSLLLGKGDGTFHPTRSTPYDGRMSYGVAAADCDRDGTPEVIVTESHESSLQIYHRNDPHPLRRISAVRTGKGARGVAVGDLDGDGIVDFAVANLGDNAIAIVRGDHGCNMRLAAHVPVAKRPRNVTIADIDGDGRNDVLAASLGSADITVLMNRTPPPNLKAEPVSP